jgi:hypothetical protein
MQMAEHSLLIERHGPVRFAGLPEFGDVPAQ